MKVIIAGSRTFDNYIMLLNRCSKILSQQEDIEIVSGGCEGADLLGERYAKHNGYKIHRFNADWATHGKKAGPMRNEQMAMFADALIVFWDGQSKGTKSMINIAKKYNLEIRIIKY